MHKGQGFGQGRADLGSRKKGGKADGVPRGTAAHPVQMLEKQTAVREKEVEAIRAQAQALSHEDASAAEVQGQVRAVEEQFLGLREPLRERRRKLLASKEEHQFNRDLEDEIVSGRSRGGSPAAPRGGPAAAAVALTPLSPQLWVKERRPLAVSTDHGKDLPSVQLLIKKNQVGSGGPLRCGRGSGHGRTPRLASPSPSCRRCRRSCRATSREWRSCWGGAGGWRARPSGCGSCGRPGRSCGCRRSCGTSAWSAPTPPSSSTATPPRPRPGWASRSCT